ncbi:DUF6090 family protein [Balneola sp. MJW-20]|uniref:DUF6090 family protein n=1 Tax=Gracilimonas aurantiaca TaxID=3234185 RepID=UPI003467BB1E
MITLFRRIRQKLIDSGSVTKYLLYATGEILLVVVGILIALQVNNWNEQRQLAAERATILENLNIEFSENLIELKISMNRMDTLKTGLAELLSVMHDQPDTLSADEFEILLEKTFFTPFYSPSSFVLEELKNSGGLTRINNEQLESLLFDWERHNASLMIREDGFRQYASQYIEFLTENGSVRNLDVISGTISSLRKSTITKNSLELLKNPVFENRAENFYYLAHLVYNEYAETVRKADKIISLTAN